MSDSSRLPRKPFGYDPTVVDHMLADRDSMLALAERRVREAEAKVARLEEQMVARELAIAELNEKIVEEAPAPAPAPEAPREEPLTPRFMTEELAKIIEAAEETTAHILSRARLGTRDQILEADRLWKEVQSEAARFVDWRDQAEALVGSLQAAIEQARAEIEGVPDRIQNALVPAVEAMVRVDSGLSRFVTAASLPRASAPAGLEEARAGLAETLEAIGNGSGGIASDEVPSEHGSPADPQPNTADEGSLVPEGQVVTPSSPPEEPRDGTPLPEVAMSETFSKTHAWDRPLPSQYDTALGSKDVMPQVHRTMAEAVEAFGEDPKPQDDNGPVEDDWPALGQPPLLDGEESVAAEATEELRHFQSKDRSEDAEGRSRVWGP